MPDARLADARRLADRLRELVASRQILLKESSRALGRVTMSIGVSELQPGESCGAWLARTDEALYAAKRDGRNRVMALTTPSKPAAADAVLQLEA
jgi:diguanylate cyclase